MPDEEREMTGRKQYFSNRGGDRDYSLDEVLECQWMGGRIHFGNSV